MLEAAGSSLDKVVKCNVYLLDFGDFEAMNEVYKTYFKDPYPARTTIQVGGFPFGMRIEHPQQRLRQWRGLAPERRFQRILESGESHNGFREPIHVQ